MGTLEEVAEDFVQQVKAAIETIDYQGFGPANASGKLSASIRHEMTQDGFNIIGLSYGLTIRNGRGPTKGPSNGITLRSAIRQWLEVKGIGDPKDRNGISYAISKQIHKRGNRVKHLGLAPTNVFDTIVSDSNLQAVASAYVNFIVGTKITLN